ncbi:MAG: alternative ribosome rescue aminoacyl-tRNA hydrolase ArfB [Acidimicrobiales bacterium]
MAGTGDGGAVGDGEDPRTGREPPDAPRAVLRVSRSLAIPIQEIDWRATTPGGPGGQHANRTASRVEVRFDVARSPSLGPRQRALLLERLGAVVTASAGDERSQARNRELALGRLAERLAEGLRVPRRRRPTAPTRAARVRRMEDKRHRSITKQGRRPASPEE